MLGMITPNVRRQTLAKLQAWGVTNGVTVKVRTIRAPLTNDNKEAVILRYGVTRRRNSRSGQHRSFHVFEFHCVSLRGDLRDDQLEDRASVLAAMIEEEFQDQDIDIKDHVGGEPETHLGSLQFRRASWRNGDQRATIHGEDVDYTLETPKTEHIVVSYTATLNT